VKPVPKTVRVVVPVPTGMVFGMIVLSVGTGLPTVKGRAFETPPPGAGVETVMLATPTLASCAVGM